MGVNITFLGGADTVTGSKYLVRPDRWRCTPPICLSNTLASGAKSVRIHGHDVEVQAEVVMLQSASAHADSGQLLAWHALVPERGSTWPG